MFFAVIAGERSLRIAGNHSEGVKKLVACASARRDGRLVEILGRGSSDVMGNVPVQSSNGIANN
jgi:hypothetical protein